MKIPHLLALMTGALISFNPLSAGSDENNTTSNLSTYKVELHQTDEVQIFDGIVEAINFSTISSQTSGRITQINFDVDDFVEAGEIIVQFADTEHKAGLTQAESALAGAIAAHTGASENFKRIDTLFAKGSVAKARLDAAKVSFEVAKAKVETATASVKQAQEQLSYTVVRAPYGGIVVKRHVEIGEVASPGQALMSGFSLDNLRVKVSVPQQFANLIRREKRAVVHDDAGNAIMAEKLTVFPYADEKSNTVTIRAFLPQSTKLVFPGMLVKVTFKTGSRQQLLIPEHTLVKRGEVNGVYLIEKDGSIHLQQIRVGRRLENKLEVLSGLKVGDSIASNPFKALLKLKSISDDRE